MGAGFTLIELIIVIGILTVISTIGIAVMDPMAQIQKANDARVKADLSQIQKALEEYYEDNGRYPVSSTDFKITGVELNVIDWGYAWRPYMNLVPKSPYSSSNYVYYSPSNRQEYYLYANLKRNTDPSLCNYGNACDSLGNESGWPGDNACGAICNYGVSSQNVSP
jgi:type II secretion system protein G